MAKSDTTLSLTARWLLPMSGPAIAGGVIRVTGDRITALDPPGSADLDFGNAAILPGFVNAHVHLDLSGMRGLAPPRLPLTDWLREVIAHRRTRSAEQVQADVRAGLAECVRTGTTLLGDVSGDGGSWDDLATSGIRCVVFRELLGLTRDRADAALAAARSWLSDHPGTTTCRPGLSPHAPYSVRADLYHQAALLARQRQCPLATHLAESRDELELLHRQRGPFVDFLKGLGVWDADGLSDSPGAVMKLCWARVGRLFVHGNHLAPSARIPRNSTIVYCPRTHAAFGHPPHPFARFLERGVRIALGTDSLASNPDLDLLAEARFVHRLQTGVAPEAILRAATLSGAEALGWAGETGSLEVGKSADLVVVPLAEGVGDPNEQVLAAESPVSRVMCRGTWVELPVS